jgi:hypothetical protein
MLILSQKKLVAFHKKEDDDGERRLIPPNPGIFCFVRKEVCPGIVRIETYFFFL